MDEVGDGGDAGLSSVVADVFGCGFGRGSVGVGS